MSKVVEQAAISQLTEYLSVSDLLRCLQSAYRKRHSIETAMLRVWSSILMAADVTLLAKLDLSVAPPLMLRPWSGIEMCILLLLLFECVNHAILLQRLQVGAGLTNVVLEWIDTIRYGS